MVASSWKKLRILPSRKMKVSNHGVLFNFSLGGRVGLNRNGERAAMGCCFYFVFSFYAKK